MAQRLVVASPRRARYSAEQVCIIPGTAAVAGITRVDEPIGELLTASNRRRWTRCSPRASVPCPLLPAPGSQ